MEACGTRRINRIGTPNVIKQAKLGEIMTAQDDHMNLKFICSKDNIRTIYSEIQFNFTKRILYSLLFFKQNCNEH